MVVLFLSKYIDTLAKSYFNPTTFCIQQWRIVNDSKRHQSYADSLLLGTLANINNATQWQIVYIWLKGCILLYSLTMLLTNIFQIDKYFPNCGIVQCCRVTTMNCVHRDFLSGLLAFILHLPCLFSIGKFIMTISSTSQWYCFCFLVMVLFWISLLMFPVAARFTITHFPILSNGISISKFLPSARLLARLPLSLKLTHQFFILHGHCC